MNTHHVAPALTLLFAILAVPGGACSTNDAPAARPTPGACSDGCHDASDAAASEASSPAPEPQCRSCMGVTRLFPTKASPGPRFEGCVYASPLAFGEGEARRILVASGSGEVAAIAPKTGATDWQITMPAPPGELSFVTATPALVGRRLVVAYHTRPADGSKPHVGRARLRNLVAVIDLDTHALDPAFPAVELAASQPGGPGAGAVRFEAGQSLGRGALAHVVPAGATLGRVYVTFGNVRDIQPWHGWMFELDLDAWKATGPSSATSAVLLTTPETDCGAPGSSGSRERRCGGGLWSPSGPLVYNDEGGVSIVVAPGNGQLDLARHDYANTLLRVKPGLALEPGCDAVACADFDRDAPSAACIASCKNVFVPRLAPGQTYAPESGACDGISLFACWQRLDYGGGSSPVRVRAGHGAFAFAYPTKDGAIYLVDGAHMGTMHDRAQLVPTCGTREEPCRMDWAGMIVTQPAVVARGEEDVVIVPTFMPDGVHPGGVVALRVRGDAPAPKLERLWEYPRFDTAEARTRFRMHPSRLTAGTPRGAGEPYGWVVETGAKGRLVGLRLSDGALAADVELALGGMRFAAPLVEDSAVYVSSCGSDEGPGALEGFAIDMR